MGLRAWLGLKPNRAKALESAFDPIKIPADPRIPAGFREFTLPPRLQRGGRHPFAGGQGNASLRSSIVPFAGVKVP